MDRREGGSDRGRELRVMWEGRGGWAGGQMEGRGKGGTSVMAESAMHKVVRLEIALKASAASSFTRAQPWRSSEESNGQFFRCASPTALSFAHDRSTSVRSRVSCAMLSSTLSESFGQLERFSSSSFCSAPADTALPRPPESLSHESRLRLDSCVQGSR
jgi:hypothetical protein